MDSTLARIFIVDGNDVGAAAIYHHYRWEVGYSDTLLALRKHGIALKIGEKE